MVEITKIVKVNRMNFDQLISVDKNKVKKIVMTKDEETWQIEMSSKTPLNLYRKFKSSINEEKIYDNSQGSVLLFRCRTNTMPLNDRNRHSNSDTSCPCCNAEYEDLLHFLLYCPAYWSARIALPLLSQPYEENVDNTIERLLLFTNENLSLQMDIKKYLCKIYIIRKTKIENNGEV